jgi:hypothetical protein
MPALNTSLKNIEIKIISAAEGSNDHRFMRGKSPFGFTEKEKA